MPKRSLKPANRTKLAPLNTPHPYEISPALASRIVDALLARRAAAPFVCWEDFSEWCDSLVPGMINGMIADELIDGCDSGGAALLKANFDPNTHLNKQLPDELMHYWLDKSDLNVWSTEGSLVPTGVFTVSCVGRVLGPDGRLLAERSLGNRVEAFSFLRQTSQKDFLGGRTPDATPDSCLSLSSGARTAGAGASWGNWGGRGLAVMTYPCPPMALPAKAADFDGAIALATVEMPPLDPPDSRPAGAGLKFLHHFDDG